MTTKITVDAPGDSRMTLTYYPQSGNLVGTRKGCLLPEYIGPRFETIQDAEAYIHASHHNGFWESARIESAWIERD
ncbi:MAG: hypothetical protein ACJ73N_14200 [Bryobacteraceae bacterium]